MFAVNGRFDSYQLTTRFPAAYGIDRLPHYMRDCSVDRPVNVTVQITAELRAVRITATGSTQDYLNGLPDIIGSPDDFAGSPQGWLPEYRGRFHWGSIAPVSRCRY